MIPSDERKAFQHLDGSENPQFLEDGIRIYQELSSNAIFEIIEKLDKPKGNLTLMIACTDCDALFELNREMIAVAIITNGTLLDAIEYVQNSTCRSCKKEDLSNYNLS